MGILRFSPLGNSKEDTPNATARVFPPAAARPGAIALCLAPRGDPPREHGKGPAVTGNAPPSTCIAKSRQNPGKISENLGKISAKSLQTLGKQFSETLQCRCLILRGMGSPCIAYERGRDGNLSKRISLKDFRQGSLKTFKSLQTCRFERLFKK